MISPHDPCVWNVDIGYKKLTMLFHVGDIMIERAGSNLATKCIKILDKVCGAKDSLAVS